MSTVFEDALFSRGRNRETAGMSILHVQSGIGGCGASAVTWAIARHVGAVAAFDFSPCQGGLAWASGVSADVSWPRIQSAELSASQLLEVAREHCGIRLCSGGSPPHQQMIEPACSGLDSSQHVIFDGGEKRHGDFELLIMPNQLSAMKKHQNFAGATLCVVGPQGVPPSLVRTSLSSASITFLKQEAVVSRALRLGYGLPQTRALRRAIESCLTEVNFT